MKSTTALWFDIETTFAEVVDSCVEARAAELYAQSRRNEARLLGSFAGKATAFDEGRESEREEGEARYSKAEELARDIAFREAHPEGADFVEIRARLRKRLTWLKSKLTEVLPDHEVYYVLFPLVVYCDELVNAVARGQISRWEPLQSELYEIDNGGELFYSILEDRLRQAETHPIVFEVFYFCLNDGFVGMYQGNPKKLDEYKARLKERIVRKPVAPPDIDVRERGQVELVDFPWRYYAMAAFAIVAGYLLLSLMAPTS